jgi:hypothetical protein
MDTKMNDPVTAERLRLLDMGVPPAPNKKLELRAVVRNDATPRSKAGMFNCFPLAFASATREVNFKVFFNAHPQKNKETGSIVVASDGREENT